MHGVGSFTITITFVKIMRPNLLVCVAEMLHVWCELEIEFLYIFITVYFLILWVNAYIRAFRIPAMRLVITVSVHPSVRPSARPYTEPIIAREPPNGTSSYLVL